MTRSVADAAAVLSVIAGVDINDKYTLAQPETVPDYTKALNADALKGKRIGIPRRVLLNPAVTPTDPSIISAFDDALETMRSLGATIVDPADLPSTEDIFRSRKESFTNSTSFKVCDAFTYPVLGELNAPF